MPNWPPSSSCVMPSTVTGTTSYHHNDLKRLFMHNPYIQGAGPATAPCPNIRTEGVEEAASRLTSPLNGENGSNGPRTGPSRFQMASAIASFLAVALGLGLFYTRVTV